MTNFYMVKPNGIETTVDEFQVSLMEQKTQGVEGFGEYMDIANEIRENSVDYNVMGRDITPYVNEDGQIRLRLDEQDFKVTDWSLNQLSTRLGVPANYAMKMADANKADLFSANFQSWIDSHKSANNFFVRTYDDTIRGFLTDSYFPSGMENVLPTFRDALQTSNMNFQVHKGIINPEYANIRVVSDRVIDIGGDPHFVGMGITTSDVGRAATKIEFFVYRSACTNGMLFGKHGGIVFRQKHTSRHFTTKEHYFAEMRNGLADIDRLADYAEQLLKEANRYKVGDKDIQQIINQFKQYGGSSVKEMEFIEQEVKNRMPIYDNVQASLWSVSNAFTEVAQLFPADKSELLENYAGHMLHARIAA